MTKKTVNVIVLLGVFLLGVLVTIWFFKEPEKTVETDTTVLIEKVREVCKLVTVEAELHEVYDEKNYRNVTLFLPLPTNFSFSKKASIEVSGKVLVGYDLEKIEISADSTNRILFINNLPKAEILSIEHDVKYRNLEESFFNEFTANDFTQINKGAKEALRKKAIEKHLLEKAEAQGIEVLDVIKFMSNGVGWEVEVQDNIFEDFPKKDSTLEMKN